MSARAARSSTSNRSAEPPTAATTRVRVVVSGRVQGVWFRDATRRQAQSRELAGWVRNRMDGTVEAVFEGPASAVAELVAWCRIGPPRADVTGLTVIEEPPEGLVGFRIR